MAFPSFSGSLGAGTAGGTLTIVLANIATADVLKTTILAAVGALVSFSVSLLLRMLVKRWRK
jgi:mannitol-specific phosphotransferase system IIBC component